MYHLLRLPLLNSLSILSDENEPKQHLPLFTFPSPSLLSLDSCTLETLEMHLVHAQECNFSLWKSLKSILLHVTHSPSNSLLQIYNHNLKFLSLLLPNASASFSSSHPSQIHASLSEGLLDFPSVTSYRNVSSLTEDQLTLLSTRTHLKELEISLHTIGENLTLNPYELLSPLTSLTSLRVMSQRAWKFARSMPEMTTLTRLTALELPDSSIGDADLATLVKSLLRIRSLNLCGNTRLRDINCIGLSLPSLTSLNLAQCDRLSDSSVSSLTRLSLLETLNLTGTSIRGGCFENALFAHSLKGLEFYQISWEGAKAYSKFTR